MRRGAIVVLACLASAPATWASTEVATQAAPGERLPTCDNKGETWYQVWSVKTPRGLTHYEKFYNGTPDNMDSTFSVDKQSQWTAGITITAGSGADAGIVIAKMKLELSAELAAAYSRTSSYSVGVHAILRPGRYMAGYRGSFRATANFGKYYCSTSGLMYTQASGTGASWKVPETGYQYCDTTPPAGSLAELAKSTVC